MKPLTAAAQAPFRSPARSVGESKAPHDVMAGMKQLLFHHMVETMLPKGAAPGAKPTLADDIWRSMFADAITTQCCEDKSRIIAPRHGARTVAVDS